LANPLSLIRGSWRKNWPEVHAGLTGGLPGFLFRQHPQALGPGVPVFCYHVVDEPNFRADLSFLSHNGYTTLTADALLAHLQNNQAAPERSVVLTFDDGQQTLNDVAFPLLREYGHTAVAFICPGLHREPDEDTPGRDGAAYEGEYFPSGGGLCTWADIQAMHASGHVDFQPHTNSHRFTPRWPEPLPLSGVDPQVVDRRRPNVVELKEDLRRAKEALDRRLGKPTRHMAFPQYYGTDEAIGVARELGYLGFYWGTQPGKALNQPGDRGDRIVRVSGEFVRRLPGEGRRPLQAILRARYGKRLSAG